MSDVPRDDFRVEIDLKIEETREFVAEQRKLIAESERLGAEQRKLGVEADKLAAEQRKLDAEAAKFSRERALSPWTLAFVVLGAGGSLPASRHWSA